MRLSGKVISSVLLFFSVVSLVVGPAVNSQTLTTITTWSTVTSQVTSTRYSTYPVGTTTIVTSRVTKTTFHATRFTVGAASEGLSVLVLGGGYDGLAGERLQGKWESDYPVNFYITPTHWSIVSATQIAYLTVQGSVSYSFDWAFPKSGEVMFLFENNSTLSDFSKQRTVILTVYKVGDQSSTSTVYSTASTVIVYPVTQTLSIVSTSQASQPPAMSGDILLFGGLLTVVVIVVVVFVVRSRRRDEVQTALKEQKQTTSPNTAPIAATRLRLKTPSARTAAPGGDSSKRC